jgi:quinol monooxygenase YgiN
MHERERGAATSARLAWPARMGYTTGMPVTHIVAAFAVRPESVAEFIRVAHETLVVPARAEPGCLRYELCQDTTDPTRFAMIEAWESAAALDAHLTRESLRAAVTRLTPMAAEPPKVARYHPVGGTR